MSNQEKDLIASSKPPWNIFTHITNNNKTSVGKIIDLSCYSARIKVNEELSLHHHIVLNFIFKSEYNIEAEILEKVTDTEYRVKFIFRDFRQNEVLKRDIHRDSYLNCKRMWCEN